MSIEVKNLLKKYGEQKAVNDISFTVNKGEIVGFLGPNGAGKSTTMKMITGYLQPDAGEINVTGIDVRKYPLEAKKRLAIRLNQMRYIMICIYGSTCHL
jgi:ABC-2 type transport system ATP-binding protein